MGPIRYPIRYPLENAVHGDETDGTASVEPLTVDPMPEADFDPCILTGTTRDGRTATWSYGSWRGDWALTRHADALRGEDTGLRGTARGIAAAVGPDGTVSESVTALLADDGT